MEDMGIKWTHYSRKCSFQNRNNSESMQAMVRIICRRNRHAVQPVTKNYPYESKRI